MRIVPTSARNGAAQEYLVETHEGVGVLHLVPFQDGRVGFEVWAWLEHQAKPLGTITYEAPRQNWLLVCPGLGILAASQSLLIAIEGLFSEQRPAAEAEWRTEVAS